MKTKSYQARQWGWLVFLLLNSACGSWIGGGSSSDSVGGGDSTRPSTGGSKPTVEITSPADLSHFNTTSVAVGGTCTTAAGTVTLSGAGLQSSATGSCSNGTFSVSVSFTVSNGNKDLTVAQTNSAGTTSHNYTLVRDCTENYVLIPADSTLGTSAFCLAKYEMKVQTNAGAAVFDGYNGSVALDVTLYKPLSRPDGIPWVRITQTDAINECASLGTGYHLVTAKEWGAMARNVESVASNWGGGTVGSGILVSGHSDGVVSASAVADGVAVTGSNLLSAGTAADPYLGTGNSSGDAWGSGKEQKRTFTLSNNEIIWDVSGNAREFNDVDGSGSSISYTGGGSSTFFDVFSATATSFLSSIVISGGGTFDPLWLLPATNPVDHATNHVGEFYIQSGARSGRIITRGANFASSSKPGVFAADFDTDKVTTGSSAGFRCVHLP